MAENIIRPPTSTDGPLNMQAIYEATGLPEQLQTPAYYEHLMEAAAAEFTDGEIIITHTTTEDPVVREHFGATVFNEGVFGGRLRQAFEGEDRDLVGHVDGLLRLAAIAMAKNAVSGPLPLPDVQNVAIRREGPVTGDEFMRAVMAGRPAPLGIIKPLVIFDHTAEALAYDPGVIVDYGAGLQGRHYIDQQYADIMQGKRLPYVYVPIVKGPFINEFLQQYWLEKLGQQYAGLFNDSIQGRIYIGREDGIAAATNEIIAETKRGVGSAAIADLVVASGIQKAAYQEVETGITNAYELLRPNGSLLVRAPVEDGVEEDEVSGWEMYRMALDAGFERDKAKVHHVPMRGPGTEPVPGLSVLFRK